MKVENAKIGMSVVFTNKSNGMPYPKNGTIGEITAIDHDSRPLGFRFEGGFTYCMCSELEPYIEPAKDNTIQDVLVVGGRTFVYLTGRRGVSTCSPSDTFDPVKGVALAYARALGQTVDDIEIVINPQPKTQDKPLTFEVGETVRVRSDLSVGRWYKGYFFNPNMEKLKGKILKIECVKYNCYGIENSCWNWPAEMLEKVPPANIEVIIDGVEWMPKP